MIFRTKLHLRPCLYLMTGNEIAGIGDQEYGCSFLLNVPFVTWKLAAVVVVVIDVITVTGSGQAVDMAHFYARRKNAS